MGIVIQDSFTGTDGTQLTAHTGEVGATWSKGGAGPDLILSAGKLVPPAGYLATSGPLHYASGAYPSGVQVAEAVIYNGSITGGTGTLELFVRYADAANCYAARVFNDGTVALVKWVGGVFTTISSIAGAFPVGTTKRLTIEATDATKRVLLDHVEILTSSDNTVAGPGTAGLDLGGWPAAAVTWDVQIDDFLATDFLDVTGAIAFTFDTLTTVTPRPPYVFHSVAGGISFARAPQRPALADRPLQAALASAAGVRSGAPLLGRSRTLNLDWRGIGTAELAALEAFLLAVGSDVFIFAGVDGVARTVLQVGEINVLEKTPDRSDLRLELLEILS